MDLGGDIDAQGDENKMTNDDAARYIYWAGASVLVLSWGIYPLIPPVMYVLSPFFVQAFDSARIFVVHG